MGYGDPDHQHPLRPCGYLGSREIVCFRCELPLTWRDRCYGCTGCNHFIHELCFELPKTMLHPLHAQHPLTLLPPNNSSSSQNTTTGPTAISICHDCHNPILGNNYAYHCPICQFFLHLKCFLTLNIQEKHQHPLTLYEAKTFDGINGFPCRTCGFQIDRFSFGCKFCDFHIHHVCTFLPQVVKHRHGHELTFIYNFPEESVQAYCEVCDDKDGKELDRSLSYYYCKNCDYIAHVHCVTTQLDIGTTQIEHFSHGHPLIYSGTPKDGGVTCAACNSMVLLSNYYCSRCNYSLHQTCAEFPRLIKHPCHEEHTLALRVCYSPDHDGEPVAPNSCCGPPIDAFILECNDCDYTISLCSALKFRHPHYDADLLFSVSNGIPFRCNACGELGARYSMSDGNKFEDWKYDIHLECFALPGKIHHDCHSHPLFLFSSPPKAVLRASTMLCCSICHTEADPEIWVYCCEQCNYIAHLKCVTGDLLSALRSSNNHPNLCVITQFEGSSFSNANKPANTICLIVSRDEYDSLRDRPAFFTSDDDHLDLEGLKPELRDHDNQPIIATTDIDELFTDVLHCPTCERPISAQAYSSLRDWASNHGNDYKEYDTFTHHNQTPMHIEPLAFLDEKLVDQLYCPICNQLIFPPTYSCVECRVFFHKSCAELPRKYTRDPGHNFVLVSPSLRDASLSNCSRCQGPIKSYAYICRRCKIALDIQCAVGAPFLRLINHEHRLFCTSRTCAGCDACWSPIDDDSSSFRCGQPECNSNFHTECALLPQRVSHRIHREHPLELASNLDPSVDYYCDVCEKKLNPRLWAYRCSDSCNDRVTSHVSCIVTSNKKCHFRYDFECRPLSRFED